MCDEWGVGAAAAVRGRRGAAFSVGAAYGMGLGQRDSLLLRDGEAVREGHRQGPAAGGGARDVAGAVVEVDERRRGRGGGADAAAEELGKVGEVRRVDAAGEACRDGKGMAGGE